MNNFAIPGLKIFFTGWKLTESAIQTCTDDIIKHSYRSSTIPKDIDEYLFSKFTQEHFKVLSKCIDVETTSVLMVVYQCTLLYAY